MNSEIQEILERNREKLLHRDKAANKGSYGKLLIIGGSRGMSGAAYLSSLAAFRTGIGMVKVFGPECNRVILQTALPEAMYQNMEDEAGDIDSEALADSIDWADIVVIGPGLSKSSGAVSLVLSAGSASSAAKLAEKELLIIDADALNIIAGFMQAKAGADDSADDAAQNRSEEENQSEEEKKHPDGFKDTENSKNLTPEFAETAETDFGTYFLNICPNTVITPHIGEMARLTGLKLRDIKEHQREAAEHFAAQYGVTVVLKDYVTAVAPAPAVSIAHSLTPAASEAPSQTASEAPSQVSSEIPPDAQISEAAEGQYQTLPSPTARDKTTATSPAFIIDSGCGAMAKAGSGDVLCGFIAGITAVLRFNITDSIPLAVYLHGRAGTLASEGCGCHSILARDIAENAAAAIAACK